MDEAVAGAKVSAAEWEHIARDLADSRAGQQKWAAVHPPPVLLHAALQAIVVERDTAVKVGQALAYYGQRCKLVDSSPPTGSLVLFLWLYLSQHNQLEYPSFG